MSYNISQIAEMIGVRLPDSSGSVIDTLLTDSRSLSRPETSLFFAIHTASNDGHRYIQQLYQRGVRAFVTDHWDPQWREMDADFIVVPDGSQIALQRLASSHRHLFQKATVIGITGSRGKTTLKEWLNTLISPDKKVIRSPRSYNSQTGVPLSLWFMNMSTEIAIIEAGISRPGEMKRLADMIDPDIAIITNIHDDHAEAFISTEEKCAEKLQLASGAKTIVFCADDANISSLIGTNITSEKEVFSWSFNSTPSARLQFSRSVDNNGNIDLTIRDIQNNSATVNLSGYDASSLENASHAAAVMIALGYDVNTIASRIGKLSEVQTRTDVIDGKHGGLIIRDRYQVDPESLGPALDFMMRRVTDPALTSVILGPIPGWSLDNDESSIKFIAEELSLRQIDSLILLSQISPAAKTILSGSVRRFHCYNSAAEFLDSVNGFISDMTGRTILVKGAGKDLDAVAEALQARRHETVLEVNLDALIHNYNFYRSRLTDESTGIVCMLKASGYGAGSYELARTLQAQGAAYIAVAVLDEGIELRRAGITMPIMVLNPRVVNYDELFAHHLEPEIFSFEELEAIVSNAKRLGIRNYPVHIKLDTGMHRLGFVGEELPRLIQLLHSSEEVTPVSVFSHLATADEPAMDDYTYEQLEKFDKWSSTFRNEWHDIKRHILNSTGITRFPAWQYEMVRLGICLYGIATMPDGSQSDLRPVSSLITSIIAIREWEPGTTIGYGRHGVCERPARVATIPVGYADGINRHLGNGTLQVSINGHRCPTIGNICMDACMIDVTACGDDVHVGDRVEIFGNDVPVNELSDALGTIPYEILTSVSTRVKRVYYRE